MTVRLRCDVCRRERPLTAAIRIFFHPTFGPSRFACEREECRESLRAWRREVLMAPAAHGG